MPLRTLFDNTYYIYDSQGTALPWLSNSKIAQIRILANNTSANVVFQAMVGTPFFEWRYLLHGSAAGTSSQAVEPALFVIPMGGVRCPTALIPTTLTAATAWIDFL